MVGRDDLPTTPGGRIALLLERSGVDSQNLADEMLLPEGVELDDVLSDSYKPSLTELLAAADVLDVPVTVLTGKIPIDGHLGVSLRLGSVRDQDSSFEVLSYSDMLLRHRALLDAWHGPVENRLKQVPMSTDKYGLNAGKVSAERVRAFLEVDDEPIGDLVHLIESLGIPVAFQKLPVGVHGLNVRDQRQGVPARVIVVSTLDRWARQRYTLAHELCHALYDDPGQVIVDTVAEPDAVPEYRAESFARHLLLPASALRDHVILLRRMGMSWSLIVPRLMAKYGISRDATVRALVNDRHASEQDLEIVTSATVDLLMQDAGLSGEWNRLAVGQEESSGSVSLVERAVTAYGNGWIDVSVVAELMGQDVPTTKRALEVAGWK